MTSQKTLIPATLALLLLATMHDAGRAQDPTAPIAAAILRSPALSPDGRTLAFVHDGDIWSVPAGGGTARRLTITEDNDGDPQFSPDGKWLAFRSRRHGSDSIYVMDAEGGPARRLTFGDYSDQPHCWLPDSSGIIFSSYRREGGRDLWIVRATGGEPWPITGGGFGSHEAGASISPDGKCIAYVNRNADPQRRRGYYGTASSEIWLCDFDGVTTSKHRKITDNRSHDTSPVFISNSELLYVTYQDGKSRSHRVGRLAAITVEGTPVSGWGGDTRLDPREITVGGGKLAFSTGNYGGWQLHVGELGKRAPTEIKAPAIKLASDVRRADVRVTSLAEASEFALSPDGKKIAFIAGGDVFVMAAEEGSVPRQITDTPEREMSVNWHPDSKQLVYTTGHNVPNLQLMVHDLTTSESKLWQGQGEFNTHGQFVGDGARIAYLRDENSIRIDSVADSKVRSQSKGDYHGAMLRGGTVAEFSPDARWFVQTQSNELYNATVVLNRVDESSIGADIRVSHLFGDSRGPRFSADGKRVVFANNQEGDYDIWVVDLTPEAPEFKEDKLDNLLKKEEPKKDEPKADETKPEGDTEPKSETPRTRPARKIPETKVQLEGLKDRARRITSLTGNESSPVALSDGKTYCFIADVEGQSNVWKLVLDPDKGPDLKQLTQSRSRKSSLTLSADERNLWWLDAGVISSMPVAGGKQTSFGFRMEQRRDRALLRTTAAREAFFVMGRYFYDDKHHGIDWAAMCKRYEGALNSVRTGDEFDALMDELLGELNSSHQGFTGWDDRSDGVTEATGRLNLLFDEAEQAKGRLLITEVVKGGACDLPEGKPEVGEYLTAINGRNIDATATMAELLLGTAGTKTALELRKEDGSRRTIHVKPGTGGAEGGLWYRRWVEWQRALVSMLSNGKLGYVHIAAMDERSLREFKHELGDEMLGKQGVVIDVRFNGGGSTAVDVLEILIKRPWLIRQYGKLEEVSENVYRSIALEKPSILMINESSFSNAEILAEGFRRLKIGQIVGVDTAGGVIGTGSFTLVDGSRMRLPSTGAFTVDGENLENNGRKPDHYLENHPDELDQGIDRQTEHTVKTLLEQLKK